MEIKSCEYQVMKKFLQLSLFSLFLVFLTAVGYAQTCNVGNIPATSPTSGFVNNGNGTVTDTKTALMWKKCSEGQIWDISSGSCEGTPKTYTWKAALEQALLQNQTGFAGFVDWRLPNVKELNSIIERQCINPAVNLEVFPISSGTVFWTSTLSAYSYNDTGTAWLVALGFEGTTFQNYMANDLMAILVRDAQ